MFGSFDVLLGLFAGLAVCLVTLPVNTKGNLI